MYLPNVFVDFFFFRQIIYKKYLKKVIVLQEAKRAEKLIILHVIANDS